MRWRVPEVAFGSRAAYRRSGTEQVALEPLVVARRRAELAGVAVELICCNAEHLPFALPLLAISEAADHAIGRSQQLDLLHPVARAAAVGEVQPLCNDAVMAVIDMLEPQFRLCIIAVRRRQLENVVAPEVAPREFLKCGPPFCQRQRSERGRCPADLPRRKPRLPGKCRIFRHHCASRCWQPCGSGEALGQTRRSLHADN